MKGHEIFHWEIIAKKQQFINDILKSSSEPTGNFNQLSKKHLWVKGIQVCTNEGPYPFPKEDNSTIGKIHYEI